MFNLPHRLDVVGYLFRTRQLNETLPHHQYPLTRPGTQSDDGPPQVVPVKQAAIHYS